MHVDIHTRTMLRKNAPADSARGNHSAKIRFTSRPVYAEGECQAEVWEHRTPVKQGAEKVERGGERERERRPCRARSVEELEEEAPHRSKQDRGGDGCANGANQRERERKK